MGEKTRISWANRTLNFWVGCTYVSEECEHCYAESMINRLRGPGAFDTVRRTQTWNDAKKWQREAEATKRTDLVFTCSLSDFFIKAADEWRPEAWKIIHDTPNLIYQILTKRPKLIARALPPDWGPNGYPNCWLGTSVGMKQYLNRMDALREIPAACRFVSAEPLLEDLCPELEKHVDGFHQIIVGGESGNGSNNFRPMPHQWARNILDVCRKNDIAFWFKQSAAQRTEIETEIQLGDGHSEKIQEYPKHYYEYKPGHVSTGLFK